VNANRNPKGRSFPTTTTDRSIELRLHIWRENQAMAEHILSQQKTLEGQVLLLCDVNDDVGGPLSKVLAEKAGCAQQMIEQRQKIEAEGKAFQTTVAVLPIGLVAALVEVTNPKIAEALKKPAPSGMMPVVIIGSGGTTLIVTPQPARRSSTGVG
jgi:hypothetical protein